MKKSRLLIIFVMIMLSFVLVGIGLAADIQNQDPPPGARDEVSPQMGDTGSIPGSQNAALPPSQVVEMNGAPESLSGSFVLFDHSAAGDSCYIAGANQTFCFRSETFTNDWEYKYSTWLKFSANWAISNVYISGTPVCDNGGGWGSFAWSFENDPYEVKIDHPTYQANPDHCVATYCVDVISGYGASDAFVSWYFDGDSYQNPPHHPCSDDNYTPASMNTEPCDEAIRQQAIVPVCGAPDPNISITPSFLEQVIPPDRVASQHLKVCNTGGFPLEWNLEEGDSITGTHTLYDNGPLITHPGGGSGGANASALQTALGMNTYGYGHSVAYAYRVADDFTITQPGGWRLDQVTFFAYQTLSGLTCTINHINYRIWNGPPNSPESSIVFGDTTTNRLLNCSLSNTYRVLDTAMTNTDRPVMKILASAGIILPPGTYWIDWQTGGDAGLSGPWAPPITLLGQTTTGNALQYQTSWNPVTDVGPQGFPFIIDGIVVGAYDIPWVTEIPNTWNTLGGTCKAIDVIFNSAGLSFGHTYIGIFTIRSNDIQDPLLMIPVTLMVDNFRTFMPVTQRH